MLRLLALLQSLYDDKHQEPSSIILICSFSLVDIRGSVELWPPVVESAGRHQTGSPASPEQYIDSSRNCKIARDYNFKHATGFSSNVLKFRNVVVKGKAVEARGLPSAEDHVL